MNVEENAYGDMVKKFRECVTQFYLYFAFFLQVLYVGLFVCHAFVIQYPPTGNFFSINYLIQARLLSLTL